MIPQEVADIIEILKDEILFEESEEQFVLDLANRIYNKLKS